MITKVYADDQLVYDSRLDEYRLLALTATCSVKKSGAASLTMPPDHPAYNAFTSHRTVLTIYKDDVLLFRGRALYPEDDFYNQRTITAEGERGFFRDAVMRPYLYQDGPAAILTDLVELYNAQVEPFKQFTVGEITATDPNNYVRLESEKAEQIGDTIDKLVERVGGYLVFTGPPDARVVNWYGELNYRSYQSIEFGENLLNFARSDENDELATVCIPYGAKDETTGERVTIASVNEGLDFIQDYDAVYLRGVIARPVYWDDVTEPTNLLAKAQQWLASHKMAITRLELTAVDLSILDQYIDDFQEGDQVRVRSLPHGVDEDFLLFERTYNLLDPSQDTVILGKEVTTLTGADAAGDRKNSTELNRVIHDVRVDYLLGIAKAVEETTQTLSSLIEQTSEAIRLEVSETYATNDNVTERVSTVLTQLSDSFNFEFNTLQQIVEANDAYAREQFEETRKYIRFIDGDIILGEEGNELTLHIENDRIAFLDAGAEVAYISNKQLFITDAHFLNSLRLGSFAWVPRENGNLSLVKVG